MASVEEQERGWVGGKGACSGTVKGGRRGAGRAWEWGPASAGKSARECGWAEGWAWAEEWAGERAMRWGAQRALASGRESERRSARSMANQKEGATAEETVKVLVASSALGLEETKAVALAVSLEEV